MAQSFLAKFERVVVLGLIAMMIVVLLATVDLAWLIIQDVVIPPVLLLEVDELLETIKAYLTTHVVHVEIVLEVALIAAVALAFFVIRRRMARGARAG